MVEVGLDFDDLGTGGGRFQDLWHLIQGYSAGGAIIILGDVGDDPPDQQNPGGVLHRVAHCLTGMQPRRNAEGIWDYSPLAEAMSELSMEEVDIYVLLQKKQYSPIFCD